MKLKVNNVLEKSMNADWDYGYKAVIVDLFYNRDCEKKFMMHLWHDDGDEFIFGEILLCSDIRKIYLTHVWTTSFSYRFTEYSGETAFFDQVTEVLLRMYPDYETVKYYDQEEYMNEMRQRCVAYFIDYELNPYNKIPTRTYNFPSWLHYIHDHECNIQNEFGLKDYDYKKVYDRIHDIREVSLQIRE